MATYERAMQLLNVLRVDYWLDFNTPTPLGAPGAWVVAIFALASFALAQQVPWLDRTWRISLSGAALLVFLASSGRALNLPLLSNRLPWLAAFITAASPALWRWVQSGQRAGAWRDGWRALSFAAFPDATPSYSARFVAGWVALHAVGLLGAVVNAHWPIWIAPAIACALITPALATWIRSHRNAAWRATIGWSPLVWSWLVVLLSAFNVRLPGIFNGVTHPTLALLISSAWALAASARVAFHALGHTDAAFNRYGAWLLLAGAATWSVWTSSTLRTHGVTGSDPFAYAQMGIDLAEGGTVLHRFPLAALARELGIAVYPVIHVGYRIPADESLMSASVWPPGFALLSALAYRIGGEAGIYWLNPAMGVLASLAVAWFTRVFAPRSSSVWPVAALTALFTLTSFEQVHWQMLPMADITTQILSLLALATAWAARDRWGWAALSGLLLGAAFGVRYTQVLLAPAIALALWWRGAPSNSHRRRVVSIAVCAACAWLAAAPVLAYHAAVFGHPFTSGSDELVHFSLANLPTTLGRTLSAFMSYRELGLLMPWVVWGILAHLRHAPKAATVLLVTFGLLLGFHALYHYLRLRDVLFLLPLLLFWAANGLATMWSALKRGWWNALSPLMILLVAYAITLRTMETWALPLTRGFNAFGHLWREQRESLDLLRAYTPENALIGSTLNSGAIELHARRLAFRPSEWTEDELVRFTDAVQRRGHVIYILDDGESMRPVLDSLRKRYKLHEEVRLPLPRYHAIGGGSENAEVPLYRVDNP